MQFIDSHAHLYADEFANDIGEVVQRAQEVGVTKVVLPNIDVASIAALKETYHAYSNYMYPMMGLHPTSVDSSYLSQLQIIKTELFGKTLPYIGVGEIGLDFYWDTTFKAEQIEVLKTQLDWALELNLPVVIHSREAYKELYGVISLPEYKTVRGVIHSFTGTVEDLDLFLPLTNWYIGINGIVTFKNSSLGEVVKNIPLDRLLIETDAPYLAPIPNRGKRNESAYLINTLIKCASIKEVSVAEMAAKTKENSETLFSI